MSIPLDSHYIISEEEHSRNMQAIGMKVLRVWLDGQSNNPKVDPFATHSLFPY